MIIAVFDVDTGQCLQIKDTVHTDLSNYPLAKELSESVEPSSIWYNKTSNTVITRTEVSLDLPDIVSIGDTVQVAIPANCLAKVNNVKQTDNIIIDTSKPNTFWVELVGPSKFEKKVNVFSYFQKRKKEYPKIVDQLDDLYHNGIDGWKATIKVTKDKYPKS